MLCDDACVRLRRAASGGVQEPNHGTDCRAFKEKLNKQADRFALMDATKSERCLVRLLQVADAPEQERSQ